jgi:O-methyltransferase involved in polyketide biosynthesis
LTARRVALVWAGLERPEVATGDAAAELRLYRSLGSRWLGLSDGGFRERMTRRTAFFDRQTLDAIDRGMRQIVIIGAGYDSEAHGHHRLSRDRLGSERRGHVSRVATATTGAR